MSPDLGKMGYDSPSDPPVKKDKYNVEVTDPGNERLKTHKKDPGNLV